MIAIASLTKSDNSFDIEQNTPVGNIKDEISKRTIENRGNRQDDGTLFCDGNCVLFNNLQVLLERPNTTKCMLQFTE